MEVSEGDSVTANEASGPPSVVPVPPLVSGEPEEPQEVAPPAPTPQSVFGTYSNQKEASSLTAQQVTAQPPSQSPPSQAAPSTSSIPIPPQLQRPPHLGPPTYIMRSNGLENFYIMTASEVQAILDDNCRLIIELSDMPVEGKDEEVEEKRMILLKKLEASLRYLGELSKDRVKPANDM